MKIKHTLLAMATAAAVLATSSASAAGLKIGMSFQEMNNPYFVTMKEAFETACKSIGAEEVVITDAQHNISKQVSDVEDMVQKKIDILLLNPTDSKGIVSAVEDAHKAGVVIVAIDAQADGPIDSFVGSKNYDAGYQAGKYLCEQLGGKGEVAILDGIPVVPILERVRGFEDAAKEFPGIKIVTKQNGKQDRAECLTVTENILQANPNLKGLFSVNDGGGLGALTAIEDSKRDVKMTSVDGHPEAVEAIVKGNTPFIATSAQFPRDQVRIGLGIALAKYWGANVPSAIPVDIKLLTKENAKGFAW
ncbi:MAG: ABC transporter substrate-binding protein [Succinivibrio sp.]|nr:ABC transporter substrate-binding protein [Succinivibrio sp.]